MSRKRRYLCSVAIGKKVYAIGGYDASSRLNAVECLDVITCSWTQVASMIHRRGLAGATTLEGMIWSLFDSLRRLMRDKLTQR